MQAPLLITEQYFDTMNNSDKNWPKENPYKVPENYFDELYLNILEQKSSKTTSVNWRLKAIYATVLALVFVVSLYVFQNKPAEKCINLSCLSDEHIEEIAMKMDANTLIDYAVNQQEREKNEEIEAYLDELDESDLLNEY